MHSRGPLVILSVFFLGIAVFLGTMIIIQVVQKKDAYVSDYIIEGDKKQILEVLNKSIKAMKNKDIFTFLDCYTVDSPFLKEAGGREGIIREMTGTKKVLTYLQNIEIKFRKDIESFDSAAMFGDASVSLRETTESLWWYGFIQKQSHPCRVYYFKKENGKWKIYLITDYFTGGQYNNDPEIIMGSVLKKFTSSDIIKILYSTVTNKGYLDLKDMQEARSRLEPLSDSLISDCRKITELDSDSAEAWYWLGIASFLKEEFEGAISSLKKAIVVSQDDAKINYKLGNRYYRAMLHCSLGQLYLWQDKIEDALNEFKVAIHENPQYSQAYAQLSRIHQMKDDIKTARAFRLKAFRYNPLFMMEPLYPISKNKNAQELFSLAMSESSPEILLKRAIELDKYFVSAYYYLGMAYSRRGEWEMAIDYLNKVIELDSGQEDPYWELGAIYGKAYTFQGSATNLELSTQNFKKAKELNPYVYELYGSLGVNYFFKGNFNKAIWALKKAKALRSHDPNVNFYLAMCLKKKLDSNIFISKRRRRQIYNEEVIPLLQQALDFCTEEAFRKQIGLFYDFVKQ